MTKSAMGKRGQELTLGTIILIVLGIAVLVFLIFGFTQGWGQLWSKIGVFSSNSNVKDVQTSCQVDCEFGETSSFCFEKKTLKIFDSGGNLKEVTGTCDQFSKAAFNERGNTEEYGNVEIQYEDFEQCPDITCA